MGKHTYPYLGPIPQVIHVHGGHVQPQHDGYSEAWYLPKLNTSYNAQFADEGAWFNTFRMGVANEASEVVSQQILITHLITFV